MTDIDKHIVARFDNITPTTLTYLITQLRSYGCTVAVDTQDDMFDISVGTVENVSGKFRWFWHGGTLDIRITDNKSHFPKLLLLGGMRQLIDEAREDCINARQSNQ